MFSQLPEKMPYFLCDKISDGSGGEMWGDIGLMKILCRVLIIQEDFEKKCDIEFEIVAENKTQVICTEPLALDNCINDTDSSGVDVQCHTEYETKCIRKYEEVQVFGNIS